MLLNLLNWNRSIEVICIPCVYHIFVSSEQIFHSGKKNSNHTILVCVCLCFLFLCRNENLKFLGAITEIKCITRFIQAKVWMLQTHPPVILHSSQISLSFTIHPNILAILCVCICIASQFVLYLNYCAELILF